MRIDEFLLARVAEDERAAEHGRRHNDVGTYANDNYGCLLVDPARVLAECEAKRRVVEPCARLAGDEVRRQTRNLANGTLRALAAVYADHPDFNPDWAI